MAHEVISERVRSVGDGLILAFPIAEADVAGQTIDTVRLYFFRVGSQTRYFQKYTQLGTINAGNTDPTDGYAYLGDTGVGSGDDIFRLETDDWQVMHFGVGTNHPDLEVFTAVSPKANGNPAQDRDGTNEDIVPGTDDRGWYTQGQIPDQFDPPVFTERVAFRNDKDGEFLRWAFHADGTTLSGNQTDLYFVGGGYKVQPVTHRPTQDLMLQMALSRPDSPAIDTILHQVGGVTPYNLGTEEPSAWKTVRNQDPSLARRFNVADITPPMETPGRGPPQGASAR